MRRCSESIAFKRHFSAPQTPARYWNVLELRISKYRSLSRVQNLTLPTQCRILQNILPNLSLQKQRRIPHGKHWKKQKHGKAMQMPTARTGLLRQEAGSSAANGNKWKCAGTSHSQVSLLFAANSSLPHLCTIPAQQMMGGK